MYNKELINALHKGYQIKVPVNDVEEFAKELAKTENEYFKDGECTHLITLIKNSKDIIDDLYFVFSLDGLEIQNTPFKNYPIYKTVLERLEGCSTDELQQIADYINKKLIEKQVKYHIGDIVTVTNTGLADTKGLILHLFPKKFHDHFVEGKYPDTLTSYRILAVTDMNVLIQSPETTQVFIIDTDGIKK